MHSFYVIFVLEPGKQKHQHEWEIQRSEKTSKETHQSQHAMNEKTKCHRKIERISYTLYRQ